MRTLRYAVLVVAVFPGAALANMSHISTGGAILLQILALAVVAIVLLSPPLFGSLLVAKGHRRKGYVVSLIAWLGLLFFAFHLYNQLSPYTKVRMSPWAIPQAVGLLALVYFAVVLICTRVLLRCKRSRVKEPHAGA